MAGQHGGLVIGTKPGLGVVLAAVLVTVHQWFILFCSAGDYTQGLVHTRQALLSLSSFPIPVIAI